MRARCRPPYPSPTVERPGSVVCLIEACHISAVLTKENDPNDHRSLPEEGL